MANNYFDFLDQNSQQEQPANNTPTNDGFVNLTARADADCQVVCDGDFLFLLNANQIAKEKAPAGQHILEFVSIDHPEISVEKIVDFPEPGKNYLVVVKEFQELFASTSEKKRPAAEEDKHNKEAEDIETIDYVAKTDGRGTYTGQVKNGNPEGKGKVVFESGSVYEGMFRNGIRHGKGVYISSNGEKYDGDFIDDMRSGRAVCTYEDGRVREELWEKDYRKSIPLQAVDLGLSVKWANLNMGAFCEKWTDLSTQEEQRTSRNWDGYNYKMNPNGSLERYIRYDEAEDKDIFEPVFLPSGWRLPTRAEFEELINQCIWDANDGIYRVKSSVNGSVLYIPQMSITDDEYYEPCEERLATGTKDSKGLEVFVCEFNGSPKFVKGSFDYQFGIRLVKQ